MHEKYEVNISMENSDNLEVKLEINETKPDEKKTKKKLKRYCSIPTCTRKNNAESLHRFPRDPKLRKKWIKACRLKREITNYITVCNDHFLPTDFIPRWDRKLKRLKSIAIPSQNLPSKQSVKKLTPEQMKKAEERAERAAKRLQREDPRYDMLMAMKEKAQDNNIESNSKENNNSKVDAKLKQETINSETENVSENVVSDPKSNVEVVTTKKRKFIVIKQDVKLQKSILDHSYSNIVCKCNKNESKNTNSLDSPEIRAARVLVELNEKVYEMVKNNEINFSMKDVALKVGEEFYFAARRYYKTTITSLIKNDFQLHFFTGIDAQLLKDLEKAMMVCEEDLSENQELKLSERIMLCFIKIRLNLSFHSVGSLFYLNEQTCKTVFYSTAQTLKVVLRSAIYWPTKDEIMKIMPESVENFKKTITVLDRTEIEIEKSVCADCRLPYILINEKSAHLKVLLGFAKSGLITYVSTAMHGRTSNETITDEAYISKVLVPSRDAIMTDGFFMEEACNRIFIECIKKRKEKPFCPEAVLKVQSKAVTETYIENAYRRFKLFKIFQSPIPFDMVPHVDDISVIICGIVNLSNQSLKTKKF